MKKKIAAVSMCRNDSFFLERWISYYGKILGYKNTVDYREKLKLNILNKFSKFGNKSKDLKETINYIIQRSK